ncbi:peptidylprolyl isomerase [Candidatus Falkowbacteria bacterium]|nr:peptidylprolyl isomerase [Candidatus Falkowbacteria bacterium]MBT7007820.1 peptidylprolyl isomerase [Candidatus Falkowbacteria bacterium]
MNIDPTTFENFTEKYSSAVISTNLGDITVKFYNEDSPLTVNNFMNLAKLGYYNETRFHRVIKDFMIQGGDPNSKDDDWTTHGIGGPGYKFNDEINKHELVKGSFAMANAGLNTNGSQFFIVTAESTPWLDGKHTNFGYVTEGLDIIENIQLVEVNQNDHPIDDVTINSIELR